MALIDMVNRLAVNHNDRVRDAVTINAGVEAVSGRRIRIRAGTTTLDAASPCAYINDL